ncbi:MAG: hypothetical protein N2999_02625 [Proteobacteria bacterium]|nr:hypothetical protein [Pseudomonadota bacterium]
MKKFFTMIFLLLLASNVFSQQFVEAVGESVIVNNDLSQARNEAILRAKWNAAEAVLGVKVKAQSVVQNFALVDEMIQKSVSGYVESYKVLQEGRDGDVYRVRISAKVVREQAEKAISNVLRVSSVAILIPAFFPEGKIEETNTFTEGLIEKIAEQNFTVMDIANLDPGTAGEVERAIKNNDTIFARSLMLKALSNLLILGKVDMNVSSAKGEEVGYGLKMPFNQVTARLNYRIITAQDKRIIKAGSLEAKGKAFSAKDAGNQALSELAKKATPEIISVLGKYLEGSTKKVKVIFENLKSLGETLAIKETLQNLAWVKSVQEVKMGEYIVEYPENTLYLANSIAQNPNYKIKDFSEFTVTVRVSQ